ncbi:MAG: hypothetical protein CISAcid_18470 [uncultured Acidilobus sp. CIS]|nr:MAG: hypothetical protein CISAcid_18470 [uncultured Acidilobus sp. CIS]
MRPMRTFWASRASLQRASSPLVSR